MDRLRRLKAISLPPQGLRLPREMCLAKHHLDQFGGLVGRGPFTHQLPLAEHHDAVAQALHILQLVRDEQDRFSLSGQQPQGGEQLFLLQGADAGCGFIKDQNTRPQPEQAQDLQLLPLANRQGIHVGIRVERETELFCQLFEFPGSFIPPGEQPALMAKDKIFDEAHGGKSSGSW